MLKAQISTFNDWVDIFAEWKKDIGYDEKTFKRFLPNYLLEPKYEPCRYSEIEFGDFRGDRKWERVLDIPNQGIRDALQQLIVYQGDTEFASVEQQRYLVDRAPSDYDLYALMRINAEEMRHGWQMSHILVTHFGEGGRKEAMKLLERRAYEQKRLLGSFNEVMENWLDMYTYTEFIDRDGKFQLKMLSHSSFMPLAMSMDPMLKEEAFHLGTGNNGLKRILKAGKIPVEIVQKYFNKWVPTAYDLFGTDGSSNAHWAYVWGLKGRYNESETDEEVRRDQLNQMARGLYHAEISKLIVDMNTLIGEDQPKLIVPDIKFNRKIGTYAHQTYTIDGKLLTTEQYEKYKMEMLPTDKDREILRGIFKENDWIEFKPFKGDA
ncbi:phenylacetate-CoA oxygenase subunit PaaI [bacterium]|nr:phenylacetate-CoA oxygenase subunit PaaI [bacterium]